MSNSLYESRILIVDDTKENIDVLGEVLSQYKRNVALNGEKAIKIAKEKRPDIILLDIMMPDMDGFEVCRILKADNDTKDIPVIFVTAKNLIEDEVRGLELGAVDFISKPISPPVVIARVKNHLELEIARKELEEKNLELAEALNNLKTTQNQLIHSEKLSALGMLVAGIAHEINSPLGAIQSSNKSIFTDLDNILSNIALIGKFLNYDNEIKFNNLINRSLKKTNTLTSLEERLFRKQLSSDLEEKKISNFEEIAEILVELGIYNNIDEYISLFNSNDALKILNSVKKIASIYFSNFIISKSVENVSKIVYSLKNYVGFDSEGKKLLGNIHETIDTILTIYHNQIKHGIEVIKDYKIDKLFYFVPDQINQVWTNIIHNSLYSMGGKGTITIKTYIKNDYAVIAFADTGEGISDSIKEKVFEPFFTTKPHGEGTGLGLDIVNKIIKCHNGRIELKSEVGYGTTFIVFLPYILE